MRYRAKIETFANGRTVHSGEIVPLPFDPEWPEAWEAVAAPKGEPAKAGDGNQAGDMDAPAPTPGTAETGGQGVAGASQGKTEASSRIAGPARGRAPKPRNM